MRDRSVFILFIFILVLLSGTSAYATHNRAGEITYSQIGDLTYRITVITYTATGPGPVADRPKLEVQFGDGTSTEVKRVEEIFLPDYYKRNKYVWEHTYPGPGTYSIVVEDPNRNKGVRNIPNSVNVVFSIKTVLTINPQVGYNNTPVLLNPPIDKAARGHTFIHNPAAFDPDGDSLSYKLAICTAEGGAEILGYTFPPFSDSLVVNELTGDLIWAAPTDTGKYNVAMTIEEWRNGIQIGRIQRDMQIEVYDTDNEPPVIQDGGRFCLLAGEKFQTEITALDPDYDSISLSASGGPLSFEHDPATFRQVYSVPGTAKARFMWTTSCNMVRVQPYLVIIKAKDKNSQISLIDSKNLEFFVHSPAPDNLSAEPGSATIKLSWAPCDCANAIGYRIYRKNGSQDFTPDDCITGVPDELGYKMVGEVYGHESTSYEDSNNGNGLQQATSYCYRVIAFFSDGAESFASNEACAELVQGFPLITNVSVSSTDEFNGSIRIAWLEPEPSSLEGTNGPYLYRIYRAEGLYGQNAMKIDSLIGIESTEYLDEGLNTQDKQWSYYVELVNADPGQYGPMGTAQLASSLFLSLQPFNAALRLDYVKNVPWNNEGYTILFESGNSSDSIAFTKDLRYLASNLSDDESYCFRVKSVGYLNNGTSGPYYNYSQIACAFPVDSVAPCPPILQGKSVCDSLANFLSWEDGNDTCSYDVSYYKLYYRTTLEGEMILLDSVSAGETLEYWHYPELSLAACYSVTAIDSVGNESEKSNTICLDECINYEIPNVFTPNEDGRNDLLRPMPYNLVEKIDLKIFSRWGGLVFQTDDPDINWDGKNMITNQKVPAGVYYYICDVYERRLTGVEPRYLIGFIHILYGRE